MKINETNFIQELNYIVTELILIREELKIIEEDNEQTHQKILILNDRFVGTCQFLPDIIEFIALQQPFPESIGEMLKHSIIVTSEILREKTRIIQNTSRLINDSLSSISVN